MRALVFTALGRVELRDVPDPRPEADEEVVAVAAAGICGSEIHGISSASFRKPPLIMGHEFSGTLSDGTKVVVNPLLSCGRCTACRTGREHLCAERRIIGIDRPGAFAERVAVPRSAIHVLPDGISFDAAAVTEPLANGIHATRTARISHGSRVGIIGCGAIGLASLLAAQSYTADIAVADLSTDRLQVAAALGADQVATELSGDFDVVIDAVGSGATHRLSLERLRRGGRAVWVGLLDPDPRFDAQSLVRNEQQVLSSYCYTRADFTDAIALGRSAPLDWTTPVGLADGEAAFAQLIAGRSDAVKVVLRP